MPRSLRGKLLVAAPLLTDPNFDRTVVLMLDHNEEGAAGVVLNRPSETTIDGSLPAWAPLAAEPAVVFVGGPVGLSSAIGLARSGGGPRAEVEGWTPVLGRIGTVDLARDPSDIPMGIEEVRVFAGYAGWAPGQLEGELEAGAWWVVEPDAGDALSADPERLWGGAVRRLKGDLKLLATYPPDPEQN